MNSLEQAVWAAAFVASVQLGKLACAAPATLEWRAFADADQMLRIYRAGVLAGRKVGE